MGSILDQSTCLGCGFSPLSGRVWEATSRCFSLFPFLSLPLSLESMDMSLVRIKKKKNPGGEASVGKDTEGTENAKADASGPGDRDASHKGLDHGVILEDV